MRVQLLVTVKLQGKSRLASALVAAQRERLVRLMLEDVLAAVAPFTAQAGLAVLSADEDLPLGGVERLPDRGFGVNASVAAAARLLEARGVERLVVLGADLPELASADVAALLAAAERAAFVLAPDAAGTGSNALVLGPPTLVAPSFGPGSRERHLALARAAGIEPSVLERPGLAHDVDEPRDLARLIARRPERYGFLAAASRRAS
jgi:2-phospho-L-lactate guanylyltransferase